MWHALHIGNDKFVPLVSVRDCNSTTFECLSTQLLLDEAISGNDKAVYAIMKNRAHLPPALYKVSLMNQAYRESLSFGHEKVVEELLKHVSVVLPDYHSFMNFQASSFINDIHKQAAVCFLRMTEILMKAAVIQNEEAFFDKLLNQVDLSTFVTFKPDLLFIAIGDGKDIKSSYEFMSRLIELGFGNVNVSDKISLLVVAIRANNLKLVEFLCEHGADMHLKMELQYEGNGDKYMTPMMVAASECSLLILQYIWNNSTRAQRIECVVAVDESKRNVVVHSTRRNAPCQEQQFLVMKYLIEECGASLNSKCCQHMSLLIRAVLIENYVCVKYLISKECNTFDVFRGSTALSIAMHMNYEEDIVLSILELMHMQWIAGSKESKLSIMRDNDENADTFVNYTFPVFNDYSGLKATFLIIARKICCGNFRYPNVIKRLLELGAVW